jgi:hypothetical protein
MALRLPRFSEFFIPSDILFSDVCVAVYLSSPSCSPCFVPYRDNVQWMSDTVHRLLSSEEDRCQAKAVHVSTPMLLNIAPSY